MNCNCGPGAKSSSCSDKTGKCDCKSNYLATDQKCTQCNSFNAYQDENGGCAYCGCHLDGTGSKKNCDTNGNCYCQGDYLNTMGNKHCRLMKGFTNICLKFGDDAGNTNSGISLKLENPLGQTCTTGNLNMNHYNTEHCFTDFGDCKSKPWVMCGNTIIVRVIERYGYVNDVNIGAVEVNFGKTKFRFDDTIYEIWGDDVAWKYTIPCDDNCDLAACSNRRQDENDISSWSFPDPYETIKLPFNVTYGKVGTLKSDGKAVFKDEI